MFWVSWWKQHFFKVDLFERINGHLSCGRTLETKQKKGRLGSPGMGRIRKQSRKVTRLGGQADLQHHLSARPQPPHL